MIMVENPYPSDDQKIVLYEKKRYKAQGAYDQDSSCEDPLFVDNQELLQLTTTIWNEMSRVIANDLGLTPIPFPKDIITLSDRLTRNGEFDEDSGLITINIALTFGNLIEYVYALSHEIGHFYAKRDLFPFAYLDETDYNGESPEDADHLGALEEGVFNIDLSPLNDGLQLHVSSLPQSMMSFIDEALNEVYSKMVLEQIRARVPLIANQEIFPLAYYESIEFFDMLIENIVIGWNHPEFRSLEKHKEVSRKTELYRSLREAKIKQYLLENYPESKAQLTKEIVFDILHKISYDLEHYNIFATIFETVFGPDSFALFVQLSAYIEPDLTPYEDCEEGFELAHKICSAPSNNAGERLKKVIREKKVTIQLNGHVLEIDHKEIPRKQELVWSEHEAYPMLSWEIYYETTAIEGAMSAFPATNEQLLDKKSDIYKYIEEKGGNYCSTITKDGTRLIDMTINENLFYDWLENTLLIEMLGKKAEPSSTQILQLSEKTEVLLDFFDLQNRPENTLVEIKYFEDEKLMARYVCFTKNVLAPGLEPGTSPM